VSGGGEHARQPGRGSPPIGTQAWPLFGLRLTAADVVLRPATEVDRFALAAQVPDDLELDPDATRYAVPERLNRRAAVLQSYWTAWGTWTPAAWVLPLAVVHDDVVVGSQTLEGTRFLETRTVDSSSWLVPSARGRGWGRQARAAVLRLAFAELGAEAAITSAWHDNHASLGVSRSLGYVDNGIQLHPRAGPRDEMVHLRLTRERWASVQQPVVSVTGFDPCRPYFGL
jgi:RimJ/RimL family protein N-acetyltransferase